MSRDHRRLRVFVLADELVRSTYDATKRFPDGERFGLQSQLRRSAVSAATNIVEGSARQSTRAYLSFLNIASASATEARYLVELSHRLGLLDSETTADLVGGYTALVAGLQALIRALSNRP